MKLPINKEKREAILTFINGMAEKVIRAELKTYKETLYSEHVSRMYILSQYSIVGMEIQITKEFGLYETVKQAIAMLKVKGLTDENRPDHVKERQLDEPTTVFAIICFLPTRMFRHNKDEVSPEVKELGEKVIRRELRLEDIEKMPEFKHLVKDTLVVNYINFKDHKVSLYDCIVHNDEILDMPLIEEASGLEIEGGAARLRELIEVE